MRIEPAARIAGHIAVPGDKSISHRSVLIGGVGEGETRIEGFGRSRDTESTVAAMRALGVAIDEEDVDTLVVGGVGLHGLKSPSEPIDCGNAGTLMKLLIGLLAGQEGDFVLTGDESLRGRPVGDLAEALGRMGAAIETTGGRPPVRIGGSLLRAADHRLERASAQTKSALLLAGIQADGGRTSVYEPQFTRDHTETMLRAAGASVRRSGRTVSVERAESLRLERVEVPGDISSAAPFITAATLVPGSELTLHGVGVNPYRTGLLEVLIRMGARISIFNRRRIGGEPVADIEVRSAPLVATTVRRADVPRMIDELPLFALAAGMARGESVVRGAAQLREKETDRIETVTTVLRSLGVRITAIEDGFRGKGVPTRPKGGGVVSAGGDHRIAMLAAVAGLVSREGVELQDPESVAVSFPGFFDLLESVTQR
ncbi:MAG TPA: 3-phosphoshikimate 1-carboxyvinyltransferase [Gaiellaceae bacterium]|nr:3-phosphoshikimate 1-carboxyvinyltransferase [Gaiellaceae bacterium]